MTASRWKKDLLGFTGIGGLSWLASVLCARGQACDETLSPEEIAGAETRFLTVAGEQVAYEEQGAGKEAIIFLHGFGGRLTTWTHVQRAFADRYRTIALDLWGFGASGRPTWISPRDWATQVLGVMDALGIESAAFVAHSLGGRVSLMCAERAPERLRSLTLIDADWGHIPHGYLLAWGIAHTPMFPLALRRLRGNRAHVHRLMRLAYGRNFAIPDALVEHYTDPIRIKGTSATFLRLGRNALDSNISRIPAGIRCPTLILWGEEDYIIPVEWAARLVQRLAQAKLHIIPEVGHFPQEEAPGAVIAHLRHFFAEMG